MIPAEQEKPMRDDDPPHAEPVDLDALRRPLAAQEYVEMREERDEAWSLLGACQCARDTFRAGCNELNADIRKLEAEVASLREDAARWREVRLRFVPYGHPVITPESADDLADALITVLRGDDGPVYEEPQ